MTRTKPLDVEEVFTAALQKESVAERQAYLDTVCKCDTSLRKRVEALLKSHSEADGHFFDVPLFGDGHTGAHATEGPGTVIGPYTLVKLIGEGGCGRVYLARQQQPLRRDVALKIVKLGMDTRQVIARFEAERQALAMMEHANIAKVFDAGATETGRPFFVMELVEGAPINEYCDANRLTLRERLTLFLDVCGAVQHAHRKGIIHRDLKPSNLLVTTQDARPVAKVIDFGIAKATLQHLNDKTAQTNHYEFLGTPQYTSPEQARMANAEIDTRTDVYSLGVVLYGLLVGAAPFDEEAFRAAGYDEIRRIVCEQEPPPPSRRFGGLGAISETAAGQRRTRAESLLKALCGDLDWIVMRAIRKDRDDRYETVDALASDIRRYLRDEPVEARKPSKAYLVSRFVKRHRVFVGAATCVLAAIITGLVLMSVGYARALKEQRAVAKKLYTNLILAADNALEHGNGLQARRHLEACQEEFRGWEWDRLHWLADRRVATLSHHAWVASSDLARDRKTLVTVGGKNVTLWDVGGQRVVWDVGDATDGMGVSAVAMSPDATRILTVDTLGVVRMWDAATGRPLWKPFTANHQSDSFGGLRFSPDGKRFATGDAAGKIRLWDADGPDRLVMEIEAHRGIHSPIMSIVFSPNGKRLVSCCADGTLKLWNPENGALVAALVDPGASGAWGDFAHDGYVNHAAFSPDGTQLVSCGNDKLLKIWDVDTAHLITTLYGHLASVRAVTYSPYGDRISSVGNDRTLRLWNATTYEEVETLHGAADAMGDVAYSPDGRTIITRRGNEIILWEGNPTPSYRQLTGHESWLVRSPNQLSVWSLGVSADGHALVSAHKAGLIKLWDARTGEEKRNWLSPNACLIAISVAISPDGSLIVSGGSDGTISAWKADEDRPLYEIGAHGSRPVRGIAISPDGQWMASAGGDKTVKVWDVHTGRLKKTLTGHGNDVLCVAISPGGGRIISGSSDATVRIWDAASGRMINELRGHQGAVHAVAVNQGSDKIVSGGDDHRVILWNAVTGGVLQQMVGHTGAVRDVNFSHDQTRIVSGSDDGTVMLWDNDSSESLWTIEPSGAGRTTSVACARFFPDDSGIVAGYSDGSIQIWDRQAGTYDPAKWHQVAAARQLVDSLTRQHRLHAELLNALRAYSNTDNADPEIANTAMRISLSRRMSFAKSLRMDILTKWFRQPSPETYRETLQMAERALRLAPDSPEMTWILGAAQYYAQQYARAETAFRRADEMWRRVLTNGHPQAVAYLAMSLHQLGRTDEARAELDRLRAIVKDDPTWVSTHFRAMGIDEAEMLIGKQ